ncbi:MAG: hypothetical protein N3D10_02775 [Candidatus Micrarchaeota archaeon]|nr:hypothetical protein [Candidatus Micrarchaeota archaeon]
MIDLNKFIDAMAYAINNFVYNTLNYLPNIFVALVVLLLGYFLSTIFANILKRIIEYLKVEEIFKKYRIEDALGGTQLSPIFVKLFKWYIMLFFFMAALEILNFPQLQMFISFLAFYLPLIFGGVLFVILSAIAGEWIKESIMDLQKFYGQKTLASVLKWFVVLIGFLVAFETIGFKTSIINQIVLSIVQAIVYGVALAFAIAFGLGGQKDAAEIIKRFRKKFDI